jgi:hypothetical protein
MAAAEDACGRAEVMLKSARPLNRQRLRLRPDANAFGRASGGGAPRALN